MFKNVFIHEIVSRWPYSFFPFHPHYHVPRIPVTHHSTTNASLRPLFLWRAMACLKMVTQSSHKQCSINVSVNSASCCWNRLMADLVSISNTKDLTSILLDMFREHWYQQNICAHLSKCTSN